MHVSIYQGVRGLENHQHLSNVFMFSCLKDVRLIGYLVNVKTCSSESSFLCK